MNQRRCSLLRVKVSIWEKGVFPTFYLKDKREIVNTFETSSEFRVTDVTNENNRGGNEDGSNK